ncbi:MAG: roadblock/LC7 domain-containing protein [Deltaproteobacteria bacterium]|nr:roadblock/LC7 domain-containing protein [Deltaproteobacteria bacterium]
MFTEILERLLRETPGALSATVMGFDGIAIEQKDAPEATGSEQNAAVEVAAVASQLKRAAEGLGAGEVREVSLELDGMVTLLRPLTPEYLLALTVGPGGYAGKGRYLMRILAPQITAELV